MKTAETHKSTTSQSQIQAKRQPFFKKEGEGSFFSKSAEKTTPFFNKNTPSVKGEQGGIQPKLTIGKPNDKYEVEADAMADKVVQRLSDPKSNSPLEGGKGDVSQTFSPPIQTKCATCEEKEKLQKKEDDEVSESDSEVQRKPIFESNAEQPEANVQTKLLNSPLEGGKGDVFNYSGQGAVQTKCATCQQEEKLQKKEEDLSESEDEVQTKVGTGDNAELPEDQNVQAKSNSPQSTATPDLQSRLNSSKGGGSPLPSDIKSSMGSAFEADFSGVRVHTGSDSVQMNKELGAQAFTHGNDIHFNQGKYDTNSSSGKHLLAHELTHTVQQGASGKSIQKKPEDYLHTEDGNQSMDGINEEVTDELGEEKNIRNPQISDEERSESRPSVSEKGDGVDEGALRESAKPAVDRKEETQPQIQESLEKVNEELNETQEEPVSEEESINGEVENLSPKEQAIVKARIAYQKAKRSPKRQTPKSVRIPEFKKPKDAQGNEVQGNPKAEAKLIEQTVKIEVLRQQAAQLKEGADQERINAAQIEGDLQMMYYGVYTSDEVVDKATQHNEIRKEGVEQSKGHLTESQERVRQVQEGLPEVLKNATEGRQESEPMADSARERKQANDNINAQDEDARQEAEERGGELESSNNDAQNIDDAIEQTHQRATTMTEQVVVAVEQNTESEAEITAMDLVLLDIDNKLGQTTAQNETAKSSLAIHDNTSQTHEKKANQLDAAADAKLKRSDELEQNIHTVYDEYHNKMASIQPDPANSIVQAKLESGVPNIQLQPDSNPPVSPEQQQQEQTNNWFAERVEQMDREVMTEFDEMNFLEKGLFGLIRTFLDIGASLSRVNWGAFTEELLLSLVDPVFLVESMGQLFNAVINPQHRENEDPLTYLLREAAGLVTAIAITFGTIAGLCLIGMGVLAVINFWFPPTLLWSPPIYAELGALMSWSGAMLWATTKIALVLHALVFIGDLMATAFSSSAQQLIDNSKQMRTDVDAAAFPIITAGTFGLFEILAAAGRRLGIIRPRTGTSEAPRTAEEARPTEEVRTDEPSQTTEPTEAPTDAPEQPVRDGESNNTAENLGDDANRPNVEGTNTVDGLEVKSEFRGDDGHTRKVLEDGQFARCTICTRCRERFPNQLQNPTLLGYLEQLEARFRANPHDVTVQRDSLAFERDLDAVRSGRESIDTVAERYGSTAGDEAMAASGAIEIPSSWDVFMANLHDVFRRRLFRFRGTNDLRPTPDFQGGEGALFLSERNPMRTLKRWYESQMSRIVRSVNRLRAARNAVNSSENLSSRMEVVQVYEQGGDWIVRDFDRSTVPLSSAIRSDRIAARILAEVREILTQMTDDIRSGARRRRIEAHEAGQRDFGTESFYTPEESSNLAAIRDIQSKIRGETVSDNLHWSDSKGKIIIIDME